ncbi:MAG: HIT family protein [Pseudomonadota bacterium]|nr:HIT family protein [Pseudomonadota bacterium]
MPKTPCPLCLADTTTTILWSDAFCRVVWVDDADYPGFCRVILNAHVKEMTDLPFTEKRRLMDVVFAVEAAIREEMRPDKINLASLGNMVPHLHWHVIPRWTDDPKFPDSIWSAARRESPRRTSPPGLGTAIALRLAAAL